MDGFLNIFDPNRNGVAKAFDPHQNGISDAFDPNHNGINAIFSKPNMTALGGQIINAFDSKKNGAADAFDPKKNGAADAFDPHKNGAADAFDPHKNGAADAFDPDKNGFNKFTGDLENKASDFFNKIFGGGAMDKILLVVAGVAIIFVMKK